MAGCRLVNLNAIHVGNSYTSGEGVFTNNATCGGVGENVTLSKTVLRAGLAGKSASGHRLSARRQTPASSRLRRRRALPRRVRRKCDYSTLCGSGTFTLTAPAISHSRPGLFARSISATVNTLPTVSASSNPSTLATGGSIAGTATADSGESAGGVVTTTAIWFTLLAQGKRISRSPDGGATWNDQGFESATGDDGNNGCIGTAGIAGVAGASGETSRATRHRNHQYSGSPRQLHHWRERDEAQQRHHNGVRVYQTTARAEEPARRPLVSAPTGLVSSTAPSECMAATPGNNRTRANRWVAPVRAPSITRRPSRLPMAQRSSQLQGRGPRQGPMRHRFVCIPVADSGSDRDQ